jgi:hypothetical protein
LSGGATAFGVTIDAAAYVPHAGAEWVLASLEEWTCDAERPMRVLRGPHGSGKSMLLAVLAARVGRHAVPVCFSANGLDPETLARTVLDALGTPWEGTPRVALVRAVEQPGTRRVLLLLDDADALAPRTEMWLFDFVRRSAGAVHALLAVRDERLAAELANAFQSGTTVLALDAPMSREEADAWVRAELARNGADAALRARFDAPTVSRLHTRSGGVPGRLRQEAAAILAEFAALSGEPAASAAREERAPVEAPPPRLAPAVVPPRPPPSPLGAHAVAAAAPPRPPGPRREPAPRETPVPPREPASARAVAPVPAREPSAPRAASAAVSDAAPAAVELTRFRVDAEAPPRAAPRRDSLLRWLLVPAALAAAYVVGFLTSQTLEALRPGAAPAGVAVEAPEVSLPSVSAAPPRPVESAAAPPPVAEIRAPDPFTPPPPLPAVAPTAPAMAAPAGESAEVAAPPAAEPAAPETAATEPATAPAVAPPVVSAAPPPAPARVRRPPPQPRNVEVSVEAEPGASILVNGQPVGSGTVKGLALAPGPHLFEVRLPDGRVVERVVDVKGTQYIVKVR